MSKPTLWPYYIIWQSGENTMASGYQTLEAAKSAASALTYETIITEPILRCEKPIVTKWVKLTFDPLPEYQELRQPKEIELPDGEGTLLR